MELEFLQLRTKSERKSTGLTPLETAFNIYFQIQFTLIENI